MAEYKYDDIINLPHYQSKTRPHMSLYDRAAQFSPFAALTGHDTAIRETERLTDRFVELDEYELAELDDKLKWLRENIRSIPKVTITYFVPDERKEGGSYQKYTGSVKKIDSIKHKIIFEDYTEIEMGRIINIGNEG